MQAQMAAAIPTRAAAAAQTSANARKKQGAKLTGYKPGIWWPFILNKWPLFFI